jgi:hypothetical protein
MQIPVLNYGATLQFCMQWFRKTWADRPWVDLELSCHANTLALVSIAMISQVGNGNNTLFWTNHWLHGCSIGDLAPIIVASVRPILKTSTFTSSLRE